MHKRIYYNISITRKLLCFTNKQIHAQAHSGHHLQFIMLFFFCYVVVANLSFEYTNDAYHYWLVQYLSANNKRRPEILPQFL